ncbi:MAG: gephyrin-like molybdotransferase Glp [Pseudomonadota bacterium]|nr:gephyrin-like molybdotransferase Glp [Pseudomonadota bacterium]
MSGLIRRSSCCDDVPETGTLKVDDARQRILDSIKPITASEKLTLRNALGRVLAEDIISPLDVPGHTNSAMDGYALAGKDLPQDSEQMIYKLIGSSFAGAPFSGHCEAGQCVRIMTGAVIPAGTDTVVMQEQVKTVESDSVRIGNGHRTGQNVRQAGEDIATGGTVLRASHILTPADLGILSSLGIGEVRVRRRPRVAFFSTGDELRSIGEALAEGDVYDSNRYSLYGMLQRLDVELLDMGVVRDSEEALRKAFAEAAAMADVVITSGGVSVGEADYIKPILEQTGEIHFWKIAMKPGRPLTHGRIGNSLFFGLPGNPVAVMVTFYQFVQPALKYLAGARSNPPWTIMATSKEDIFKRKGRYEFQRGILEQDAGGQLTVRKTGQQGSGILMSMSRANCFILLPEDCQGVSAGEEVQVQPFDSFI